jgi:hypothetical protein
MCTLSPTTLARVAGNATPDVRCIAASLRHTNTTCTPALTGSNGGGADANGDTLTDALLVVRLSSTFSVTLTSTAVDTIVAVVDADDDVIGVAVTMLAVARDGIDGDAVVVDVATAAAADVPLADTRAAGGAGGVRTGVIGAARDRGDTLRSSLTSPTLGDRLRCSVRGEIGTTHVLVLAVVLVAVDTVVLLGVRGDVGGLADRTAAIQHTDGYNRTCRCTHTRARTCSIWRRIAQSLRALQQGCHRYTASNSSRGGWHVRSRNRRRHGGRRCGVRTRARRRARCRA